MEAVIVKRYAQALLSFAKGKGKAPQLYKDCQHFVSYCQQVPQIKNFLADRSINQLTKKEKIKVFSRVFQVETIHFLQLIIHRGRATQLCAIVDAFIKLYEKDKKIHIAEVTTAQPITDGNREQVLALIKKLEPSTKEIRLTNMVDPTVLGGYRLKIGHAILDATLVKKLQQLQLHWSK